MNLYITDLTVQDIRFPASSELDISDVLNHDPNYSAAYVTLHTNQPHIKGFGLTFTRGRGNELCVAAVHALKHLIIGKKFTSITQHSGAFWQTLTGDNQLRWLGPDKGVVHLATAAVMNAVWDLWARIERKPVWRLIVDMSPEELIECIDFSYITDVITPDEAMRLLRERAATKHERLLHLLTKGYPAYTTAAGWLGFSEEKLRFYCYKALKEGWTHLKFKVGANLEADVRRLEIAREILGDDRFIMLDANQKWDVNQAIEWIGQLARFNPWWIEEPTSPDDILGHAKIRKSIAPIKVATGEHCHNRVMFKQLFQAAALDFCQIDSCRLGGINEILAVLLMAAKFNVPICPHAGGVGLCEYVQHLSIIDYIYISGSLENRVLEYVDHLHEHFMHPVVIQNGHYQVPTSPGYSIEMKGASLTHYHFPYGRAWYENTTTQ